jgi:hypothetical protein
VSGKKILGLAASVATLVGLSVLVTGGFAQSSGVVAAAKKRGFVLACTQRKGGNQSKGDLNVRLRAFCAKGQKPLKLALWPVVGKRGPRGHQGPQGAQGPTGPQGPPGAAAATPEYAAASVFVARGGAPPARFATYSAVLGSPAGTTASGDFRFTCSAAQAPCKISFGAAVISNQSGTATVYPRLLIHKEAAVAPNTPITFCEYADGADNNGGSDQVARVPTLTAATSAMQTPLSMGIGGSLDCGSTQTYSATVTEIWVPSASSTEPAYYDVAATFTFR